MTVKFFRSADGFRKWLARNHARSAEIWVGFFKSSSGRKGLTYAQAVDQALCFGWIDGVRRRVDDVSYAQRFSPRKPRSNWSQVNVKRVEDLASLGLMAPPGVKAFEARDTSRRRYSYEARPERLPGKYEKVFRAEAAAWEFFQGQAPWYRRVATWWVISAVKEETRLRRLRGLIDNSGARRRIGLVTSKPKSSS